MSDMKPTCDRVYDNEGYMLRGACVCVKPESESEVLLVTSARKPEKWIIPGGGVQQNESFDATAIREVLEEAGVIGHLKRCLGVFENKESKNRTMVYVMAVTDELADWQESISLGRRRQWFHIDEALRLLSNHKPLQQQYLQELLKSSAKYV